MVPDGVLDDRERWSRLAQYREETFVFLVQAIGGVDKDDVPRLLELGQKGNRARPWRTCARASKSSDRRFSRMTFAAAWFDSINIACDAPRLNASIPTAPVPA